MHCVSGIGKGHKRRRYGGKVLNGAGSILGDEGGQEIEFSGEVVNLWHGVSPEERRELY